MGRFSNNGWSLVRFSRWLCCPTNETARRTRKTIGLISRHGNFWRCPRVNRIVLLILSGAWDIIIASDGQLNELWVEGTMGFSVQLWIQVFLNDLVGNNSPFLPSHFYGWYKVMPFFALLIPFMSMFRLAKFNLDERQATGFIGLPTPANSLFFASFALMLWDGFGEESWKTVVSMTLIKDQILLTFVVVFSILLVAEIPLFALKFVNFKWQGNQIRYIFLLLSLIAIWALWVWAIPVIVLMYLLLSVINNKVLS